MLCAAAPVGAQDRGSRWPFKCNAPVKKSPCVYVSMYIHTNIRYHICMRIYICVYKYGYGHGYRYR